MTWEHRAGFGLYNNGVRTNLSYVFDSGLGTMYAQLVQQILTGSIFGGVGVFSSPEFSDAHCCPSTGRFEGSGLTCPWHDA